ncbi:MAG: 1-phosphofructokinase family hexose kinase [Spirochaetota bacterium]
MKRITTVTMNPAVDKSARVEQITANDKLRATHVRRDAGGGGINVSRAIVHLGGQSVAVFVSGGVEGELLERLLGHDDIEQRRIEVAQPVRENLTVVETTTGRQYRFGMPGPHLSRTEVDEARRVIGEQITSDGYLVASGSLSPGVPDDFYAALARTAREHDARFIVDTSGPPLHAAINEGAFLIKPNLRELAGLVGQETLEGQQVREAAEALVARGAAEYVVVSLGSGGAWFVSADGAEKLASPTVAVESRIGAGDSMVAGMVLALDRGQSILDAVRYGTAAGAAAVMDAETGLGSREHVDRLYQQLQAEA